MMRSVLCVLLTMLMVPAFSQKQDNNWCFGKKAGVSFNNLPPTGFSTQIQSVETNATVSDRQTGQLLFYTDGYTIWDASHNIMQNGVDIGGDSTTHSSAQGAVIVPFINDAGKYYVFATSVKSPRAGYLYYSIVDMAGNNGLGTVVPGSKKIFIDSLYTEAMAVVPGCGRVWLITQKRHTGEFHTYQVTGQGVHTTPVVSTSHHPKAPLGQACFAVSPDGKQLVVLGNIWYKPGDQYFALHNIDKVTGSIYNTRIVDTAYTAAYNSCKFSPDGSRLYITAGYDGVMQYDMSLSSVADIKNSRQVVYNKPGAYITGIQAAPDGNMYLCRYEQPWLDKLSNPDALFPGCTYHEQALQPGGLGSYRLPPKVVYANSYTNEAQSVHNLVLCSGNTLKLQPGITGHEYTWQDGSSAPELDVSTGGTYWVEVKDNIDCKITTDSFYIEGISVKVTVDSDTTICPGDTIYSKGSSNYPGAELRWGNNSTGDSITISMPGRYTLSATYKGCADTASLLVEHHPLAVLELGDDRTLCEGDKLILPDKLEPTAFDSYLWQDGSTSGSYTVTGEGVYYVQLSNKCQVLTDSIYITGRNCHFFFPSAFTPNNDGRNDIAGGMAITKAKRQKWARTSI